MHPFKMKFIVAEKKIWNLYAHLSRVSVELSILFAMFYNQLKMDFIVTEKKLWNLYADLSQI